MRKELFGGLAASVLLFACAGQKKTLKNESASFPTFSSEGHRGARGLMPENTFPAMKKAIDLGITTLEMDVLISKDRKVVVSHDNYFSADFCLTPEGKEMKKQDGNTRFLFQMNYDSIVKYDVGMKFHAGFPRQQKMAIHKPLLEDLLTSTEGYAKMIGATPKWYNIETKTQKGKAGDGISQPGPEEFVDLLVAVLRKTGVTKRTVIQSFDMRTLQVLNRKYPEMKTSLLMTAKDNRTLDKQLADLGFTPFIYSPEYKMVTPELVKACHVKGMKIVPWTVNNAEELQKIKDMKVDGIISDYPDLFQGLK